MKITVQLTDGNGTLTKNIDSGMFSFYVIAKYLFKQAGLRENCEISKDFLHPLPHHTLLTETLEDQNSEQCEMLIKGFNSNISSKADYH